MRAMRVVVLIIRALAHLSLIYPIANLKNYKVCDHRELRIRVYYEHSDGSSENRDMADSIVT